jgi:hypothetical protein
MNIFSGAFQFGQKHAQEHIDKEEELQSIQANAILSNPFITEERMTEFLQGVNFQVSVEEWKRAHKPQ